MPRTPLEARTSGARLGNRSVFIVDPGPVTRWNFLFSAAKKKSQRPKL